MKIVVRHILDPESVAAPRARLATVELPEYDEMVTLRVGQEVELDVSSQIVGNETVTGLAPGTTSEVTYEVGDVRQVGRAPEVEPDGYQRHGEDAADLAERTAVRRAGIEATHRELEALTLAATATAFELLAQRHVGGGPSRAQVEEAMRRAFMGTEADTPLERIDRAYVGAVRPLIDSGVIAAGRPERQAHPDRPVDVFPRHVSDAAIENDRAVLQIRTALELAVRMLRAWEPGQADQVADGLQELLDGNAALTGGVAAITPEEARTLHAVWSGDAFDAEHLESVQPKLEAIAGESWR